MRIFRMITTASAAMLFATAAEATSLQLEFTGSYDKIFDQASGKQETLTTPQALTVDVLLPLTPFTSFTNSDSGITTEYPAKGMKISGSFVSSIGPDPVGDGLSNIQDTTALADVDTVGHGLAADLTLIQNVSHSSASQDWQYNARLAMNLGGPLLDGDNPFVMTPDTLAAILAEDIGQQATYNTGWSLSNVNSNGSETAVDGISLISPSITLASVKVLPDIPEPATWLMFIGGFGLLGAVLRGQRRATLAVV